MISCLGVMRHWFGGTRRSFRFRTALLAAQMRRAFVAFFTSRQILAGNGQNFPYKRVKAVKCFRTFRYVFVEQFVHVVMMSRFRHRPIKATRR